MSPDAVQPEDLGLVVSPYLAGCNIDARVAAPPPDQTQFDPGNEQHIAQEEARAKRLFAPAHKGQHAFSLVLRGAGFDVVLSRPRALWYRDYVGWKGGAEPRIPQEVYVALEAGMQRLRTTLPLDFGHVAIRWLLARALMTDDYRAQLRERLVPPASFNRQEQAQGAWGPYLVDRFDLRVMQLAVVGGFEAELDALYDGSDVPVQSARMAAVLARRTAVARVELLNRWNVRVTTPDVQPLLVSLGREALGPLASALRTIDNTAVAEQFLSQAGSIAHGPGMAGFMLDQLTGRAARSAYEWLRTHPAAVLRADLTQAQVKAAASIAREWPHLGELLDTALDPRLARELSRIVDERALPCFDPSVDWWAAATKGLKPLRQAPAVAPVVIGGAALAEAQLRTLAAGLASEDPEFIAALRAHLPAERLDELAIELLDGWLREGAPPKEGWRLTSAGLIGGARFALHLAPLIRQWPGMSQHKRAVSGLEALRNVGTDLALQQISGIAASAKHAGIKRAAAGAMAEIAQARGLTRDQLEDRIIPDGGLDARGRRVFDYGPRQFEASVTPDGRVAVRLLADGLPTGKPRTALPTPNKSDDPEMAAGAKEAFATLRKTLTTLAKTQAERFERAMVLGRRWTPAEFEAFVAPQPVLRGLLSGVVWGVFDADQPAALFRMDEDGAPVGVDDEPVKLNGSVGVVHPLSLTDQQREQWAQVLADYELRAPFRQLDRPVALLPASQGADLELHDVPKIKVPAARLFGAATRHGWERGAPQDAGATYAFARAEEAAGLTVVIEHEDGMWMGPMAEQEEQTITRVLLFRGIHPANVFGYPGDWGERQPPLSPIPWSQAPATLVSEVYLTVGDIFA